MKPIGQTLVAAKLLLAICSAAVVFGGPAVAKAGLLAPQEQHRLAAELERRPMIFFVARGPANSCGPGCSEWIAAIGRFDADTTQRFRDLLGKLNGRVLPVFFHSPGGMAKAGIQVGYLLRQHRMAAGVGRTQTAQCRVFDRKDTGCQKRITAGESITARLITSDAQCHSACVMAFAGASSRRVASGAMLGVHSLSGVSQVAGVTKETKLKVTKDAQEASRRYYLEVGIDPGLHDLATKTSARRIYLLSREEMARFGLETRDGIYETPWATTDLSGNFTLMKSVTRRTATEPAEYLTYRFLFFCAPVTRRPYFAYQRDLARNPGQATSAIRVTIGDQALSFQTSPAEPGVESGVATSTYLQTRDGLAKISAAKAIGLSEKFSSSNVRLEGTLSTGGLEKGLSELRNRCVVDPQDVFPSIGPRA